MNFNLYFIFVAITFVFFIYKYWGDSVPIFLILICFQGFFAYYGKGIENTYKIFIALYAFYLFFKYKLNTESRKADRNLLFAFSFFTISYFFSAIINTDPLILVLSQYFSKFLLVFISFLLFKKIYYTYPQKFEKLNHLFFLIIIVQIFLSIFKYLRYNMIEGIVGTLSSSGGAIATTFPVYAIILIWLYRKGFLKRTDWILMIGIFFIGFSSNKRALWFILPIMLFLIFIYIPRKKVLRKIAFLLPFLPLIFYVGVRLNPTLNPERKVWGSFDFNYMMDYTTDYSLGTESKRNDEMAYGRVSSTILLIKKIISLNYSNDDLFGIGQTVTRSTTYKEFLAYNTGLGNKVAMNGFYRSYLTAGIISVFAILIWFWLMIKYVHNKRLRLVLIFFLAWDYFFYHGNSMDSTITMVLVVYIVWASNYLINQLRAFTPKVFFETGNNLEGSIKTQL